MRVLAVLYCFPPLLVPAALCYLKLMLGLRAEGVAVEVVVIDPDSFLAPDPGLVDTALNHLVPPDMVRHVVYSGEATWWARTSKRFLGTVPPFYRRSEPKKREWVPPALRALRALDLDRFDLVLTCSQPHANHLIGLELKQRTGLPWVAYFSDPWSRNPYAAPAPPRIQAYHRDLEERILEGADHVLYTSEEMRRLALLDHRERIEGKSGELPHAFVPEWYAPADPAPEPGPVRLLHTGHFYGPRTPTPLLDAVAALHREQSLEGRLEIHSYGNFPAADRGRIEREGLGGIVRIHSVIPYLTTLRMMPAFDHLLLVDARLGRTEESVFLPSKLVDYLGSGSPVLAITPVPGTTARVVAETGGRVADIEDPAAIRDLIRGVLEPGPPAPVNREAVDRYHYRTVARRLLTILDSFPRTQDRSDPRSDNP